MKRILIKSDAALLEYLRGLLEQRGIAAFVRNAVNAGSAAGELTPMVAPPELWVLKPEDHAPAENLVARALADLTRVSGGPWRCPGCGEMLEAQFDVCWRCGGERPPECREGSKGGARRS